LTPYENAFDALLNMAVEAQEVYADVRVGVMPEANSLCINLSPASGEVDTDIGLRGDLMWDIVCNAKHKQQGRALAALVGIHNALTRSTALPTGDGWQILSIASAGAPSFLSREKDGQYLYGSGLSVKVYFD